MNNTLQRQWKAALKTGTATRRVGRPRKEPALKSRIVPISVEPKLLRQIDKFAKAEGISRSQLVAEGLRLRMKV